LYNAQSPIIPHIIWKGKIYTVDADNAHNIFIKIYSIKKQRELKADLSAGKKKAVKRGQP